MFSRSFYCVGDNKTVHNLLCQGRTGRPGYQYQYTISHRAYNVYSEALDARSSYQPPTTLPLPLTRTHPLMVGSRISRWPHGRTRSYSEKRATYPGVYCTAHQARFATLYSSDHAPTPPFFLELLHVGSDVDLLRERRAMLRVQVPVALRDLKKKQKKIC